VLAGALLIVAAGLATVLRGQDWPVMSARYDLPRRSADAAGARGARAGQPRRRAADSASMWESLSGGEDPTEGPDAAPDDAGPAGAAIAGPADQGNPASLE
jgi:hypothetical protein